MRIACALVLAVALAGCAGVHVSFTKPPPPMTDEQRVNALEARVYAMVEEERLKIDPKAKPLTIDAGLAEAARTMSTDYAKNGYSRHKGPEGDAAVTLILDKEPKFRGLLGENVASQYYTKDTPIEPESFARRFVDTWLGSPEHKANLSFALYDKTGVGVAAADGTVYVTELFSTDLGLPEPPDEPGASPTPPAAQAPADKTPPPIAAAPAPTPPAPASSVH